MILTVKTAGGSYPIHLERGGLSRAGGYLRLDRQALIVTDDGVPAAYAAAVAATCSQPAVVTLPQGEPTRCMAQYTGFCRRWRSAGSPAPIAWWRWAAA